MANNPVSKRGAGRSRRTALEPYLLLGPAFLALGLFFFGPVLYNVVLSFQKVSFFEVLKGGPFVGLQNYAMVFQDPITRIAAYNTVFWLTLLTVTIRLVLGMGLAVMVNASVLRRYRLSAVARALVLLPWAIPPVVAVAAWQWLLHPRYGAINQVLLEMGLIDQGIPFLAQTSTVWWAVVAMIVWRELPVVTISFLAGLQSIPQELSEAARIDGASELQIFRRIVLPLLMPVIGIVSLLTTIWTFNNFLFVWTATRGGPGTYTQVFATQLYTEVFINYRMGTGAAIGVLMSLVMALFAVVYFRFVLRRSLEGG